MTVVEPIADITGDGYVDIGDLRAMADAWLVESGDAGFNYNADLYRDGKIDNADVDILSENWIISSPAVVYKAYYYHFDGLGSVIALSNTDGEIVETYRYDVYGRANTTGSVGNIYFFTGREYDTETGLYYYRARMYNPSIGRFMQTDPVGYKNGINWYLYCRNNPVLLVDPSGLCDLTRFGSYGFGANLYTAGTIRASYVADVLSVPNITNTNRSWLQSMYNSPEYSTTTSRAMANLYRSYKPQTFENPGTTSAAMNRLGTISRVGGGALIVAGVGISAYNVATADDHYKALTQEGGGTLGAVGGAWAGAEIGAASGAAIGAWFGGVGAVPGAAIGAVVGGIVGGCGGGYVGHEAAGALYEGLYDEGGLFDEDY